MCKTLLWHCWRREGIHSAKGLDTIPMLKLLTTGTREIGQEHTREKLSNKTACCPTMAPKPICLKSPLFISRDHSYPSTTPSPSFAWTIFSRMLILTLLVQDRNPLSGFPRLLCISLHIKYFIQITSIFWEFTRCQGYVSKVVPWPHRYYILVITPLLLTITVNVTSSQTRL